MDKRKAMARKARRAAMPPPPPRQHRLTDLLLDPLVRMMEQQINLRRERTQELAAVTQGLLLPIAATRRAAMLERAIARNRQLLLAT
jgi:hypothetical protein